MVVLIFFRAMTVCDGMSTHVRRQKADFPWVLLLVCGVAGVFPGCVTARKPPPESPPLPPRPTTLSEALAESVRQTGVDGEQVVAHDLDRDGRADLWVVTALTPDGRERTVRKEIDLSGDGTADLFKRYDPQGRLLVEAYDADFDGKLDAVVHYADGTRVRAERDEDADGRADVWVFYDGDRILRREEDRDGDGEVDYREEWEDGTVTRITPAPPSE